MREAVHVVGVGRTDFKRHFQREGRTVRDVILEPSREAILGSALDPSDIQCGIVGNFAAGLFTRQLHLGAILTEAHPAFRGIPTFHVEAACASGGVAVLTAARLIMGGVHDVVLVVGAEQQKTMPTVEGSDVLMAASDYHGEKPRLGDFAIPKLFAEIARAYKERHGLTDEHLARVAVKNRAHAQGNPLAQMRGKPLTLADACRVSGVNPLLAPPLRASDCSPVTDGGAALVMCSGRFAQRLKPPRAIRLLGFGHTTDHLSLAAKQVPEFPVARKAADQAYAMASMGPKDLHGAEVHDCFSISEIVAYEILRFAETGGGVKLLESGATTLPSCHADSGLRASHAAFPVNPGGGLMGDGHPVGATGVRQVVEAFGQLTETAGERQIHGARRYLTFNMGGTMTSNVVMIWGTEGR